VYEYNVTGWKKCRWPRTRWREKCAGRWNNPGWLIPCWYWG